MRLVLVLLISVFAIFIARTTSSPQANTANLVLLRDSLKEGAACLDGSPPAFYFQAGSGTGARKWQIHHEGGGWCTSFGDCYGRSTTTLGSSKTYGATMDLPFGYMSSDANANPLMYNWNKVYLKYCDGASFSGNNDTVGDYNGHPLYFRGFRNLNAYYASLAKDHNLQSATEVVIGGCSAGGLATYLHVDWWSSLLPKSRVVGMPDSGFFLDYNAASGNPHYSTDMRWVFAQQNTSSGVNQACLAGNVNNPSNCFFAEHTSPHLKTPIFPLQPDYDSWQAPNILGSNNAVAIDNFGAELTTRVKANLLSNPKHGIYLDSCYHHCDGWGPIHINGANSATAMAQWYTGGEGVFIQGKDYPCSTCCNSS